MNSKKNKIKAILLYSSNFDPYLYEIFRIKLCRTYQIFFLIKKRQCVILLFTGWSKKKFMM